MHIFHVVEDVDRIYAQNIATWGKGLMVLEHRFGGNRTVTSADPFGHRRCVGPTRKT